jgi:pimeloyl-ACP methyl ester carboxylesterase
MSTRRILLCVAALLSLTVQSGRAFASPSANTANPELAHTTVLFVGGYGTSLASTLQMFRPLRDALEARAAGITFAHYSYAGWNAQTCAALDYQADDTGQDFETSKRLLLDTIHTLHTQCGAARILVIGHSLGGLIAFHALADNPMAEVSDIVTVDSPLGGAPAAEIAVCIDSGMCVDGPVSDFLSGLHGAWEATGLENAARVTRLAAAGIRVTAWGNQHDCLYAPAVCLPFARALFGAYDVRDTQWLGVDRAMRRDYGPRSTLASLLNSHMILLSRAAADISADLFT